MSGSTPDTNSGRQPTWVNPHDPSLDFDKGILTDLLEKQAHVEKLNPAELREGFTMSVKVCQNSVSYYVP